MGKEDEEFGGGEGRGERALLGKEEEEGGRGDKCGRKRKGKMSLGRGDVKGGLEQREGEYGGKGKCG